MRNSFYATGRFNLAVDSSADDGEIEVRICRVYREWYFLNGFPLSSILNITELSPFLVDVYKCLQQKLPALFSQEKPGFIVVLVCSCYFMSPRLFCY
uniref:Uncharacterized protein n=1 Tax=Timema tahoe TaxID=61484 RepID=A0A7R9NWC9_9NEOP|nr:unnamed protein product [Timema tahoe]